MGTGAPHPDSGAAAFLVVLGAVVGVFGVTEGASAVAAAGAVIMGLLAAISPPAALAAYALAIPYDQIPVRGFGFGPFTLWTPALAAGLALNVLKRPTGYRFPGVELLLFLGLFLILAAGALLAAPALVPDSRAFVSIAQQLGLFALFAAVINTYPAAVRWLVVGLIASAVIALVVAFSMDTGARLSFPGGDVRSLANALGIATILGVAIVGLKSSASLRAGLENVSTKAVGAVVLVLSLALILTVSRGVIGATVLAIVAMVVLFAAREPAAAKRILGMSALLAALIVALAPVLDAFTRGWLARRIVQTIAEGRGIALRFEIWTSAFSEFDGLAWMVGVGPGQFREFGTGMYSHSVFVSFLHSGGLLASGVLAFFIGWNFMKAANQRIAWVFVPFVVFLVASFAMHGSVHSKPFWLTLLIVYAIGSFAGQAENPRKRRGPQLATHPVPAEGKP